MSISKANKTKLENLCLTVLDLNGRAIISKKFGTPGNNLPTPIRGLPLVNIETNETTVDEVGCPEICFWLDKNKYELLCWNWVPGPGPGDFHLQFDTEDEAMDFIIAYYFEKNEYFEARRQYEETRIARQSK